MLSNLSIRNIVLIEAVDVACAAGLTVLTGETGAGKSIILDSLSLALGERADRALIRAGAREASVAASFEVEPGHPAFALIAEAGIAIQAGEPVILRRAITASGQSRAFINDAPVGAQLLKAIGEALVEIHGQGDEHGLLDPRRHRDLLDSFAGLDAQRAQTGVAFAAWQSARQAADEFETRRARAAAEEEFLTHAAAELAKLDARPGEEAELAEERAWRLNASRIAEDVAEALGILTGDGLESRLGQALRRLERAPEEARRITGAAAGAFERAIIETQEARAGLEVALDTLRHDPARLAAVEERLFALRSAARKYRIGVDEIAAKRAAVEAELAAIRSSDRHSENLQAAVEKSRAEFLTGAEELSKRRRAAAAKLDGAVNRELAPLKLGKAEFATAIEEMPLDKAGAAGLDRVEFRVRTNPGTAPGPLKEIASGGELARFVLALKVVLARTGSARTLIFDEVDRGIGGAVADAVGERLARLAQDAQVFVVTHSPQVAARGEHHFLIAKADAQGTTRATLTPLDERARREEIARMLSGSKITDEARAAAERLLSGAAEPARARRRKASA